MRSHLNPVNFQKTLSDSSGFADLSGLFALIFALELVPMVTFIRVRLARKPGLPLPQFSREAFRRISRIQLVLVVSIVVVAAFMARGAWLF